MPETAATDADAVCTTEHGYTQLLLQVVEHGLAAAHELLNEYELSIDFRETVVHVTRNIQTVTRP